MGSLRTSFQKSVDKIEEEMPEMDQVHSYMLEEIIIMLRNQEESLKLYSQKQSDEDISLENLYKLYATNGIVDQQTQKMRI